MERHSRWLPHADAFALLLGALLSTLGASADTAPSLRGRTVDQILVFDAGSSGTRVHIFNLRPPAPGADVPEIDLSVRGKQMLKVKPGLSYFAQNEDLDGVQKNIEDLLEFANTFVPEARRSATPALLKATAGLRSVPKEQADAVLERVRKTLGASGYKFQPAWANIIKGKEEGGLAWVAANYLEGTFGSVTGTAAGAADRGSLGVIEMGGGSTQVTFQVDDSAVVAENDAFVFTTFLGKSYRLYAHSYLGFGQDHAQMKLHGLLPESSSEDPCYPVGYRRKSSHGVIRGAGDTDKCQKNIENHLVGASTEAPGRYSSEASLKGRFVATENFVHALKELSLPPPQDFASVAAAAKIACSRRWEPTNAEVAAMEGGSADIGKPNNCFGLSYQTVLLRTLDVPSRPDVTVHVAGQINGGDIEWALGAALIQALDARIPHKGDNSAFGSTDEAATGGVFSSSRLLPAAAVLVGLFSLAGVLVKFQARKKQNPCPVMPNTFGVSSAKAAE